MLQLSHFPPESQEDRSSYESAVGGGCRVAASHQLVYLNGSVVDRC